MTLRVQGLSSGELERIVRQCSNLISLAIRPSTPDRVYHPTFTDSPTEIPLPNLRSLTLFAEGSAYDFDILERLRVPSMKDFTVDHSHAGDSNFRTFWRQSHFSEMLSRSGCSLNTLNLLGSLQSIAFETLLPELPWLVKLVVSTSNPIPGRIFEMMIRGEVLGKLEHLECAESNI